MSRRSLVVTAALAVALGWASASRAATLVNDTWIDDTDSDPASPTFSEAGTDSDSDGNLESAWFQGGVGTLDPVAGGGPGPLRMDLTATGGSSASWTTYFTPEGSEVNLANSGDKLRVTWVFTLSGVNAGNTSQNFRFALVDASARSTANRSLPASVYAGYAVFANMGPTLGNSNPFQLRERTLAAAGNLLNSSGDFNTQLGNGAATGNAGYAAGTEYTMVWTMTRNGTGLDIDASIRGGNLDGDGLAQVSLNDPSPNSFKYDTFGIRPSGETTTASVFDTSLFRVEFLPVPEPTTASMLALVGLAALGRRRRN